MRSAVPSLCSISFSIFMRPLLKTNMQIESIQQQTTAQNQSNVGRYLRKKPIQFCLAWVPCILCIPLLTFILQLLSFVRDDLGIVKNELVVNDIYFENLCDSENMLVKLNISQRWNATFDVYLSDVDGCCSCLSLPEFPNGWFL